MNSYLHNKKIVILGNYFGKPPAYFQLWMDSCAPNDFFSWVIFSDVDASCFHVPNNLTLIKCSQMKFKERLEKHFDYEVRYERPWDACAFKPCTGTIFQDVLEGADYWGWTDFDLIYGDLRPLISLIGRYDKIMPNGHFSLVRNTNALNKFILRHRLTEKALSIKYKGLACFDEGAFRTRVLPEYGATEDGEQIPYVHLKPRAGSFRLGTSIACEHKLGLGRYPSVPFVLTWHRGILTAHFVVRGDMVEDISVAYVHFFRREMAAAAVRFTHEGYYLIKPNVICEYDGHRLSAAEISSLDHARINWAYFLKRLTLKTLERKIARCFIKGQPYE